VPAISPLKVRRDFFPHLCGASRTAWDACIGAAFGESLTVAQAEIFCQYTGRTVAPTAPVRELWLVCGRRAGKSETTAFLAVYLACFKTYKLSKGEKAVGMLLAADRKQARVIMRYVTAMLHATPILERMIVAETQQSVTLNNGLIIEVHTSNFRSVRGYTIAFVICDEIAFWKTDESANPDTEVLNARRPALGTTGGMLICLSSPYARKGELYRAWRDHYAKDDDPVLVWKAPTRVMNSTFPQAVIDQAYAEDPAAASAEYGAEFRSDVQALFEPKAIEACESPERERLPSPGVQYRAFVDPAGGSGQDSMTLAIAHTQDGVEVLDVIREVRPPFNPEDVAKEFATLLQAYRLRTVTGDRFGGEWPRERFRAHGIDYQLSPKTKTDVYREVLPLVNATRVELLDDKRLLTQLASLERRVGRGGRDSIDHPPGGHDDVVNAAAGALVGSSGGTQYRARII
jgi:hypothetical protein